MLIRTKEDWKVLQETARISSVYDWGDKANSLENLLKLKPIFYGYENVDGHAEHGVAVYINGDTALQEEYTYEHANNHTPTDFQDAPTIGEQIAGKDIKYLEIVVWIDDSYNNENWEESFIVELQPLDIKKIRRRIEDALRKTNDNNLIIKLANELGVKLI